MTLASLEGLDVQNGRRPTGLSAVATIHSLVVCILRLPLASFFRSDILRSGRTFCR